MSPIGYKLQLFKFTNYSYLSEATVANFQNNRKIWISCVDKALLSDGKNIVQAKQWLHKYYSDSAPSETTVKRWYSDFKGGRIDSNDGELSGRPDSAVVSENIKNFHKLVLAYRKLKLREIAKELLLEGSVFTILHRHLLMRKLCSKLVLRLLAVDQKQQHVVDCLQLFQHKKRSFGVNKWQWMKHGYTTSLRSQIGSQRQKTQTSAGRVLASVFWDAQGIFVQLLLWEMKNQQIRKLYSIISAFEGRHHQKRPQMKKEKKVLFHRDNAPSHKLIATEVKLRELHFELLPHHPISLIWPPATTGCLQNSKECSRERDLAPMKKWYRKMRHILRPKKSFYKNDIEFLEKRRNQCFTLEGEYVDE